MTFSGTFSEKKYFLVLLVDNSHRKTCCFVHKNCQQSLARFALIFYFIYLFIHCICHWQSLYFIIRNKLLWFSLYIFCYGRMNQKLMSLAISKFWIDIIQLFWGSIFGSVQKEIIFFIIFLRNTFYNRVILLNFEKYHNKITTWKYFQLHVEFN